MPRPRLRALPKDSPPVCWAVAFPAKRVRKIARMNINFFMRINFFFVLKTRCLSAAGFLHVINSIYRSIQKDGGAAVLLGSCISGPGSDAWKYLFGGIIVRAGAQCKCCTT